MFTFPWSAIRRRRSPSRVGITSARSSLMRGVRAACSRCPEGEVRACLARGGNLAEASGQNRAPTSASAASISACRRIAPKVLPNRLWMEFFIARMVVPLAGLSVRFSRPQLAQRRSALDAHVMVRVFPHQFLQYPRNMLDIAAALRFLPLLERAHQCVDGFHADARICVVEQRLEHRLAGRRVQRRALERL